MNRLKLISITLLSSILCSFAFLIPLDDYLSFFPLITHTPPSQPIAEIEARAIVASEAIGGGFYSREIDTLVPFFPALVEAEWLKHKAVFAERIGRIAPGPSTASASWSNSAASIDQLITDAKMAAPDFFKMCAEVSLQIGGIANFGIKNQYMVKSKKSIERKVQETQKGGISREESISKIRDVLRGTIIVDTVEQIPLVIQALKEYASKIGREIIFINIWNDNRPSGYVGIHAKILFPIYDNSGKYSQQDINAEIQIHLRSIMDGTERCAKEQAHLLYHHMPGVDPKIQMAASKLLYLTALKQYYEHQQ